MNEIGRLLGSGKEAEVYEYGELVLKLYRPKASKSAAFREAANLAISLSRSLCKHPKFTPSGNTTVVGGFSWIGVPAVVLPMR